MQDFNHNIYKNELRFHQMYIFLKRLRVKETGITKTNKPSEYELIIRTIRVRVKNLSGRPPALTRRKRFKTASNAVKHQRIRQESNVSQFYSQNIKF